MRYFIPVSLVLCCVFPSGCQEDAPSIPIAHVDVYIDPIEDVGGGEISETSPETTTDPADVQEEVEAGPIVPECEGDADCDDGDVCTVDLCKSGYCEYGNNIDPCDDGDACTVDDVCAGGACAGTPLTCDDGNDCTFGICVTGDCKYHPAEGPACAFTITVETPNRGETIDGSAEVVVEGHVQSLASPVETFTLNGEAVAVSDAGNFSTVVIPRVGVNVLQFAGANEMDQEDARVQSFLYGDGLHVPGTTNAPTLISNGAALWLGAEVFDDDDTSDVDDLATITQLVLGQFDLESSIPNPLVYENVCTWDIVVDQIGYTVGDVELDPIGGGIRIEMVLEEFVAHISAIASWCPDAIGWIYADTITITTELSVTESGNALNVDVDYVDVEISDCTVDLQEGLVSVFDWLIDFFEDDIADEIEEGLEAFIPQELAPVVNGVLNELTSYDQEISIPTIGSDDAELPLKLTTALASTTFSASGASVALNPGISVVTSVLEGPGSIIRGSCGPALTPAAASETASGALEKSQPGEMAIQEDLLNQFTFQAWSGGYFDFALDDSYIAELSDGAAEDLEGLNVQVSTLAPPVLTTCTESGSPQIQLSGVHVTGSFVLNGSDASVDLYVSAFVNVDMGLVTNDKGGMNIGITQAELVDIHVDVQQTTGLGELGDAIVELLLVDLVMDLFTGELVETLAYGMPVPTVDLSNWLDTVPAGTLLTFVPYGLEMTSGNVLMEGALAVP